MNTEKRKLTGLNKVLIGFGVLVIIGGIMDLQSNLENGLGMFYTIAMAIIGAAIIYFGGGFFRRTVSDKVTEVRETGNDNHVANSEVARKLLSHVSAERTDRVFIGFNEMVIYPLNEEFPKPNGQKSEFRTLGKEHHYNYAALNYNSLQKDDMYKIASYIGRQIFHNEFNIVDSIKIIGGDSSGNNNIVGIRENLGGGYTVITHGDLNPGHEVFLGYIVSNGYGRRQRDERVRARYREITEQRRDLL